MMQLFINRHSIRRYTDEPVSADDLRTIVTAALLAPTSKSARPWQFVTVTDKETLLALAACKPVAAHSLKTAQCAVVVCADPAVSGMYPEDCAIAAQFMQLQAATMGIGSCWVQVRGRENAEGVPSDEVVRRILDIPENIEVECIMSFGYSAETRRPVDLEKLKWDKVHDGKWNATAEA